MTVVIAAVIIIALIIVIVVIGKKYADAHNMSKVRTLDICISLCFSFSFLLIMFNLFMYGMLTACNMCPIIFVDNASFPESLGIYRQRR